MKTRPILDAAIVAALLLAHVPDLTEAMLPEQTPVSITLPAAGVNDDSAAQAPSMFMLTQHSTGCIIGDDDPASERSRTHVHPPHRL